MTTATMPAPAKRRATRSRPLTAAEQQLVADNVGLVHGHLIRRFGSQHRQWDDLRQEGVLGLVEAAKRFDPARGTRFSTYADWWVRNKVDSFIRARVRSRVGSASFDDDDDDLGIGEPVDTFDPIGELEDYEAADVLARAAVRVLNDREREVLSRRADGETLQVIGATLGLSKERIRQIEQRAVARARAALQPLLD